MKKIRYYASAKQTAWENGLFQIDSQTLVDLRELKELNLEEWENSGIMKEMSGVSLSPDCLWIAYCVEKDSFIGSIGIIDMVCGRVFEKNGKFKYNLFVPTHIKHTRLEKENVYDGFGKILYDVEIGKEIKNNYGYDRILDSELS